MRPCLELRAVAMLVAIGCSGRPASAAGADAADTGAAAAVAARAGSSAADSLGRELEARGIPAAEAVVSFAATPAIERFAAGAVAGASTPSEKAERLYEAVRALKRRGAIVADRDNSPKARAPKTAGALLEAALSATAADRIAGCYELTVLFVALARSVGVEAVGVAREPVRDTGQIGHVLAGARTRPGAALELFDLQNDTRPAAGGTVEIGDLELAAQHYSHLAVASYLARDYARALREIGWALRLAPDVPGFLANRATIQSARGELAIAVADAAAAVERAPAVPVYRYTLGRLLLASGDTAAARAQLEAALALHPGYGVARRDLGWALLLAGDDDGARRELEKSARERPAVPDAALYLGLFHLARGERSEAEAAARTGLGLGGEAGALGALIELATGRTGSGGGTAAERARLESLLAGVSARRAPARKER